MRNLRDRNTIITYFDDFDLIGEEEPQRYQEAEDFKHGSEWIKSMCIEISPLLGKDLYDLLYLLKGA